MRVKIKIFKTDESMTSESTAKKSTELARQRGHSSMRKKARTLSRRSPRYSRCPFKNKENSLRSVPDTDKTERNSDASRVRTMSRDREDEARGAIAPRTPLAQSAAAI